MLLAIALALSLTLAPGAASGGGPGDAPAGADSAAIGRVTGSDRLLADTTAAGRAGADTTAGDSTTVPPAPAPRDYLAEMRANFDADSRTYWGVKVALDLLGPWFAILTALLVLFSGLAAKLRDIASALGRSRWVQLLVVFTLYTLILYAITFPLAWYDGFAVEHRFGLSDQSLWGWLGDQAKGLAVGIAFLAVAPVLWLAYRVIEASPRRWWVWLGLGTLPLVILTVLLEPLIVDPLFNRFTPLRDPQLEARILALAERAGIPGRHVYQVDRSQQTRKFNAYVTGFGVSQRIVLWDTMLEGMEEDEILFVMGHEMGHYRLGHIWKGMVLTAAGSFVVFWLVAVLASWAVRRFGATWGFRDLQDPASLPLLAATLTLVVFLAQPVANGVSRAIETEADVFGLEVARDNDAAARAFLKLGIQNRSNPEPPAWVRLALYSHPTLAERVRLALTYRPWEEGRANRVFREP